MRCKLRKICCHPYLFDWPRDPETGLEVVDQSLIAASGQHLFSAWDHFSYLISQENSCSWIDFSPSFFKGVTRWVGSSNRHLYSQQR